MGPCDFNFWDFVGSVVGGMLACMIFVIFTPSNLPNDEDDDDGPR